MIYLQYLQTASQKQQKSVLNAKSENKNRIYFKNLITTKTVVKLQICFILSLIKNKSNKNLRKCELILLKKVYKILTTNK